MPRWVKITLVVLVVVFIGAAAAVIVAARWLKTQAKTLQTQAEATVAEAREFGRGKDAEACLGESLNRVRACSGFVCEAKVKVFMSTCLRSASPARDLCANVPRPTELIAVGKWQADECARRGFATDRRCIGIIGEIPLYCSEQK